MTSRAQMARIAWRLLEPIHAVTYFAPEPIAALKKAGYRGFWMGYFSGRSAPLGAASPELVHALFYNFHFDHVRRALPDAWKFAPPEAALQGRLSGSTRALARYLGPHADTTAIERACDLAGRAALDAPIPGRALYAANRALPVPDTPLGLLWHHATLLREHRGDGHVAALTAAGITGRQAHVLHALTSGTPTQVYVSAREYSEKEWSDTLGQLADRGLVGTDGRLTPEGSFTKQAIEEQTDTAAATAYTALTDPEMTDLIALLRPITRAVINAGELPTQTPMGLNLNDA